MEDKKNKIVYQFEDTIEKIINEREESLNPFKSVGNQQSFNLDFNNIFNASPSTKINESFSEDFIKKLYFIESKDENQESGKISFLEKKTSRNNIKCPKENSDRSKIISNKKEKSKSESESNVNGIIQNNAYKSNEKNNLNVKKIKEEYLINEINGKIFEFFFSKKNISEFGEKKDYSKHENFIKNLLDSLKKHNLIELLKDVQNSSFATANENMEENKKIILLLEKNSFEYIKEIFSKYSTKKGKISNNYIKNHLIKLFRLIKIIHNGEEIENDFNDININANINQNVIKNSDELNKIPFDEIRSNKNNLMVNQIIDNESNTSNKTYETKNQEEDISKEDRKSNLFIFLIKKLVTYFIKELNKLNGIYVYKEPSKIEKDFKNKNSKINFLKSDFRSIVDKCKKKLKDESKQISEEPDNQEKVENLIKMKKIEYFNKIIKNEKGEISENLKDLFKNDKDIQIKNYQQLKCKNKIYHYFRSKNIEGLISVLNFVNFDKHLYYYVKKEKLEEFEKAINDFEGSNNFSIKLTENENKNIEKRKEKIMEIAEDIKGFVDKIIEKQVKE